MYNRCQVNSAMFVYNRCQVNSAMFVYNRCQVNSAMCVYNRCQVNSAMFVYNRCQVNSAMFVYKYITMLFLPTCAMSYGSAHISIDQPAWIKTLSNGLDVMGGGVRIM